MVYSFAEGKDTKKVPVKNQNRFDKLSKERKRVIYMGKANLKIEIPKNCDSCGNVKIINGKMYCTNILSAKPLEIDTLSENRYCPLLSIQKKERKKKTTNADKIRNMSDEELAEFLEEVENLGFVDESVAGKLDMIEYLQMEVDV